MSEQVESGTRLNGLNYQLIGNPFSETRTPIVFLHEGLGSIGQWKGFPEALCSALDRPGIVYERKGHGRSEVPDEKRPIDYLKREGEEDLPRFLNALEIGTPVDLVGHSDGGTIALYFAARFPERVRRAVTIAAHYNVEEKSLEGIRRAVTVRDKIIRGMAKYHNAPEHVFDAWAGTWLHPDFRPWNMEEELRRVTCPLLVVQGARDEYATEDQVDGIMDRVRGHAEECIIPNVGHSPHIDSREQLINAILTFDR